MRSPPTAEELLSVNNCRGKRNLIYFMSEASDKVCDPVTNAHIHFHASSPNQSIKLTELLQ